ncbi:MAG: LamG-like jellyroll fold domain-containing protein, partial [Planctomycetota bacterium]
KKNISADGRTVRENEAWIKNQTCFRAEARDWRIVDNGKKVLTLYKDHKIAHLRESFTPYWDYTPVIMKVFRGNEPENGIVVTSVPEECTQTEHVYRIDFRNLWQGTAWVDAASSLPLRVTGQEKEYGGQTGEFEITFDYEPIADDVFSVAVPAGYRELPRIVSSQTQEERRQILLGKVVDDKAYTVANARVFASFAKHGLTDESGQFSLLIPPTDSTNSLGPMDFPMFVWAYQDYDPYRVAWTMIRHPDSAEAVKYAVGGGRPRLTMADCIETEEEASHTPEEEQPDGPSVEESVQGVKLVIEDENNLAQYVPGDPGELIEESDSGPIVQDIVLVMGPASVLKGWVTNASGEPIAGATVQVAEMEIGLGSNKLSISNLDHDWKAEAFALTDSEGCYQLSNLPVAWSNIALKADADGYAARGRAFKNDGGNTLDGCDFKLEEGPTDKELADVQAGGMPVKGGGNAATEVVPAGLCQDLVLYYSFNTDNGEIVSDTSGNGNNGQVQGTQYITDDILGGAMAFDGQDDIVSVPEIQLGQFTFAAWVKRNEGGLNNRRIFLLTDGEKCYALQGNGRSVGVYVADGVEVNEFDWRLAEGTWTHITLTHDKQTFKIYRNGTLTEAGDIETGGVTGTLYIGGTSQHRGGFWHGMIDEVAIFDRALGEEEVEHLFNMTGIAVEQENTPDAVESTSTPKGMGMYGGYRRARTSN